MIDRLGGKGLNMNFDERDRGLLRRVKDLLPYLPEEKAKELIRDYALSGVESEDDLLLSVLDLLGHRYFNKSHAYKIMYDYRDLGVQNDDDIIIFIKAAVTPVKLRRKLVKFKRRFNQMTRCLNGFGIEATTSEKELGAKYREELERLVDEERAQVLAYDDDTGEQIPNYCKERIEGCFRRYCQIFRDGSELEDVGDREDDKPLSDMKEENAKIDSPEKDDNLQKKVSDLLGPNFSRDQVDQLILEYQSLGIRRDDYILAFVKTGCTPSQIEIFSQLDLVERYRKQGLPFFVGRALAHEKALKKVNQEYLEYIFNEHFMISCPAECLSIKLSDAESGRWFFIDTKNYVHKEDPRDVEFFWREAREESENDDGIT